MRTQFIVLALAAGLLASPLAAAQNGGDADREADDITFYGHVFGHGLGSPMPANTIPQTGEDNYGLGTSNGYCSSTAPGLASCSDVSWNKIALFSSPGPVQVNTRAEWQSEGEYSVVHNERGQTLDIQLDESGSVTAGIYLTYDMHGWFAGGGETNCLPSHPENLPCLYPYWGWDPGVFEDVVVKGTLYAAELGDFQGNASNQPPVQDAVENGDARVIAEGQWGPGQVTNGLPNAPTANHFQIDLGQPASGTIDQVEDFFLVYETFQQTNGENYLLDNPVRWYSGELFPHTFSMPVENAITVEQVVPSFSFGKLALVGVVNMPWGSYDVSDETIDVSIQNADTGQTVTPSDQHLQSLPLSQSLAHGGHYDPVNKTLIWDFSEDDVSPGTYEVTFAAENLQGSSSHACSATFTIEASGGDLVAGSTESSVCGQTALSQEEAEELAEDASEE